jgi:hypothetical protein
MARQDRHPRGRDAIHSLRAEVVGKLYGEAAAAAVCIQYGGSVKPDNAAQLMARHIDGAWSAARPSRPTVRAIAKSPNGRPHLRTS